MTFRPAAPLLSAALLLPASAALADHGEEYCEARIDDISGCMISACGPIPDMADPAAPGYANCMEEVYEECDLRFAELWTADLAACGAHEDALADRPRVDGEVCAWEYITVSFNDMWVRVCTSSAYPDSAKYTYGPYNLVDFDDQTAWAENVPEDGLGEYIAFEFEYPVRVNRFEIQNGYAKNSEAWANNGRVAEFYIVRPGHDGRRVTIADTAESRIYNIPGDARPISWIGFQISAAVHGRTDPDTVITGLAPY